MMMPAILSSPHFAPLSRPEIEHAIRFTTHDLSDTSILPYLHKAQSQVFADMHPVIERRLLSTEWLMQKLAEYSQQRQRVSAETISRWRENNLLSYERKNLPSSNSAAALLIMRLLANTSTKIVKTKWAPTQKLSQDEPQWWCWRQDSPQSPIIPCPIPFKDVPHSAFLWTNWQGAIWEEGPWLPIGNEGAVRWAGVYRTEENQQFWKMTEDDLRLWDPNIPSVGQISPKSIPMGFHTLATLTLLRLAFDRVSQKNE